MATVALILPLAGFTAGWILSDRSGWLLASQERPNEAETLDQPPPQSTSIPSEDVDGSDIPGLNRYPGSVRIEYIRETQGEVIWTEVEYLTEADLSQVREFYRDAFRTEHWSVNDVGYAQNAWVFFVVEDEREVFVEIRPRGAIVEVDIEQTEPIPEEETQQNEGSSNEGSNGEGSDDDAGSDGSGQSGQQAPETQPPPEAAPAPVYDDDEDDDYEDDYDDLYDD